VEKHGLKISDESVRQLMILEGLWKPKRAKAMKILQIRERRACFGELVQIDGSDHDWFEGRGPRCTLLVFIDDATGQLGELWFVPHESFFGYAKADRHYLMRYGRPVVFYSDKHGIFRVNQGRGGWNRGRHHPVWTRLPGSGGSNYMRQHTSSQRAGGTRQPDPPGPTGERSCDWRGSLIRQLEMSSWRPSGRISTVTLWCCRAAPTTPIAPCWLYTIWTTS
jgi:hypothetical protein